MKHRFWKCMPVPRVGLLGYGSRAAAVALSSCFIAVPAHAINLPAGAYTLTMAHSAMCVRAPNALSGSQLQQGTCDKSAAQTFNISATDSGYYKLINASTNLAMDVRNASHTDGAAVQQVGWGNSYAQHYYFQVNNEGFIIRSRESGKCVELQNGVRDSSGVLVQMACSGAAQQTFLVRPTTAGTQTIADGRYTPRAVHSGKCLDVPNGSSADSVQLQQYTCNGTSPQQFDFRYVGNNQYEIKNATFGKCLDVRTSGTANGTAIQQYTCNQTAAQRFIVSAVGDGSYQIKSSLSGNKPIDIAGVSLSDGAKTQIWDNLNANNQKWMLDTPVNANIGDGVYTIKPTTSTSKCIDVPNNSVSPGQGLQQYDCNGGSAQSFKIVHQANGYYKISHTNGGLDLSVRDFSESDSARIEQGEEYSSDNRLFRFEPYGAGYLIRPKSSYKCFDIAGNSTANGAALQQYNCNFGSNQIFKLGLLSSDTAYSPGAAVNSETIVLIHGFSGWGRGEMFGMKYWGGGWSGGRDLQEYLKSQGHNTVTVGVGPISSNWDRAVEAYAELKGGCVDYGIAHAQQHGHLRMGRCYSTPLLGTWDASHKIHIFSHSQGGQTARVLLKLLRDGSAAEMTAGSGGLFTGGRDWIHSITTVSTPHKGTTLTNLANPQGITQKIVTEASRVLGLVSGENVVYDLKLDQWGLTRNAGEGWTAYFNRINDSSKWAATSDSATYDLSPAGAPNVYGGSTMYSNVYYFSYSNKSTFRGIVDGHQYPILSTFTPFIPQSWFMGFNSTSAWWENDSVVNTSSMNAPAGAPVQAYNGTPVSAVWQSMGVLDGWDHVDMVGLFTLKDINPMYLNQAKLVHSLP
jgi:triacylglycerol esterase/lipase EstA (alpha/beta hydrolase family)